MTLFERFTNIWTKDQDARIAALTSANAEMHDMLTAEREHCEDAARELRPFQEYVDAADALAASAAADAAAQRDAAADVEATEAGDGTDG
jgi:hypothetical protein